jgi:AsmA family protein
MATFYRRHRVLGWVLGALAALVALLVIVVALFDWNALRGPVARLITAKTGRPAAIDGDLKVHLWSWTPTVDVQGLHVGNPPWAKHPVMFGAEHIDVSFSLGHLLRGQIVLPKLQLLNPEVNLERDAKGQASWEFTNTVGTPSAEPSKPTKVPTIRLLVIRDGKVTVEDQIKKLTLNGTLNADEKASGSDTKAFQLRLTGLLNAKPLKVQFDGGPLLNLDPHTPYDFAVQIVASTIHVDATVSIIKPFDLSEFNAKLHLSGNDIAGNVRRTDALFQIDKLNGRIGGSDISGSVGIDTGKKRLALKAQLESKNLDIKDLAPTLGVQHETVTVSTKSAPGRAAVPAGPVKLKKAEFLLPDADLQLNRVRGMDADFAYHAQSVTAPKLPMKEVTLHLVLKDGDLKLDPLSFGLDKGAISGKVEIDARHSVPETSIDMRVEHVDLSQFKSDKATQAPLTGELGGRLRMHGSGASIHKLASSADGGLGVAVPHGEVSDVLAELTGINVLKGLGLLFSKDNNKTEIRCGVIDFEADKGELTAKTFLLDTTNVLITGRGGVNLGSEAMNLALQGDPKKIRLLRLRAPVSVTGTLSNPTVGIKPEKLALQAGAGVALGVLLTPAAAALAFIDPGLAKDANCAAVLGQEKETQSQAR